MATRLLEQFNSVSHCAVCQETLTQARFIQCGHTFCLECIQNMQLKGLKLECPLCKKAFKIPKKGARELPPNYMAIQVQTVVDEARETLKHPHCDSCQQNVSQYLFCWDCESNLCQICKQNHQSLFPGHQITEDLDNIPTTHCPSHPGKMISFYCSKCREAICPLCATNNHAGSSHTVIPLQEAREQSMQEVTEKITLVKDSRMRLTRAQDRLDETRKSVVNNYAFQKARVESAALKAVKKIEKEKNELTERIREMYENNIHRLDMQEQTATSKSTLLDNILNKAEQSLQQMQITDFSHKSLELIHLLEDAERDAQFDECDLVVNEYDFNDAEFGAASTIALGCVTVPRGTAYTDIDLQKSYPLNIEDEKEEGKEKKTEEVVERNKSPESAPLVIIDDQTQRKNYNLSIPVLERSFALGSGIPHIPMVMVGLGLLQSGDLVYAYNTNGSGQVVLCSKPDLHQVLYQSSKEISAFSLFNDEECGFVLEEDYHINRLLLTDVQSDQEVTCLTREFSCRASKIGALAYNPEGTIVISDTDKNCLMGIDRENKRPINLNGNTGSFSSIRSLATGPEGEIILYDSEKKSHGCF